LSLEEAGKKEEDATTKFLSHSLFSWFLLGLHNIFPLSSPSVSLRVLRGPGINGGEKGM